MSEAAAPALTRRALLSASALAPAARHFEAMRSLGFAAESPYRGPLDSRATRKARRSLVLGAGLAGMTAAFELRRAGYQVRCSNTTSARAAGTGRCAAATSMPNSAARRRFAASIDGPLSQSGAVAHSLPSSRHARLLPQLRRRARAIHPAQPQRLSAQPRRLRRQSRSASARSRRISTAASPSFSPRRSGRARSTRRCRRRTRKSCSRRCATSARSTRIIATGPATIASDFAAIAETPAAASAPHRSAGEPIGFADILTSRLWRSLAELPALRLPDDDVSAGRRHGPDRRSLRARIAGRDPLPRQGDEIAQDETGVRSVSRISQPAARFRRRAPTGASARCRSRF